MTTRSGFRFSLALTVLLLGSSQLLAEESVDTSKLPPVRAFEPEDDSLLIEWIFPHHRVGFSIESDRQESGWFLVSDKSAQSINAWGYLPDENIEWLMSWLLKPITDYYS